MGRTMASGSRLQAVDRLRAAYDRNPIRVIVLGVLGVAALVTTGLLLFHQPFSYANQPFPDAHEYLNAATRLAYGHGYTTTVRDNPYSPHIHQAVNPPRFPPGTSLILAPFSLIGSYPANVEFGARLLTVGLVVAAGWTGLVLAGWYAALLTALIVSTSQFVLINSHVVMSDTLAALLIVVVVPLLRRSTGWSVYFMGFLAGYGLVVRESGVVVLAALVIVLSGWDRLRALAAAVPPILGLALYDWSTFGAPWRTGQSYWLGGFHLYSLHYITEHPWPSGGMESYYEVSLRFFHLISLGHGGYVNVVPNLWFYPLMLLGFSTVFGPPWFTLIGLVATVWWRRLREARFTLVLAVLSVLFYMPNYEQDPRYPRAPASS